MWSPPAVILLPRSGGGFLFKSILLLICCSGKSINTLFNYPVDTDALFIYSEKTPPRFGYVAPASEVAGGHGLPILKW
jgi:hypothetical protein